VIVTDDVTVTGAGQEQADEEGSSSSKHSEVLEAEVLEGKVLEAEVLEAEVLEGGVLEGGVLEGEVLEGEMLEGEVLEGEAVSVVEAAEDAVDEIGGLQARRRLRPLFRARGGEDNEVVRVWRTVAVYSVAVSTTVSDRVVVTSVVVYTVEVVIMISVNVVEAITNSVTASGAARVIVVDPGNPKLARQAERWANVSRAKSRPATW